jgi:parallel beta-helix repeat protein
MTDILSRKMLIVGTMILFVSISCAPQVTCIDISISDVSSNNGDILYVGGSGSECYETIQSAINDAKSGDTVFVYNDSSPYYENIVVDKSINIVGEDRETTIIDGNGNGHVVHISADYVNISSFSIQNSGNDAGVSVNSDNNIIFNNDFNNNDYCIRFEYSHNNIVSGNKLTTNNNYGIYVYESSNVNVFENTVTDNLIGIQLCHKSKENVIYGNTLSNNERGINLDDSSHNDIYWNIITENQFGVYSSDSSYNYIYDDNIISDNDYGFYLHRSSYSDIYNGNTVSNNRYGVYLYDCSNINIHENDIKNNKHGVSLNDSSNNDIYWNNIEYNKYGIYFYHSSGNDVYLNNIENNYQIGLYICFGSNSKIAYNNFITNYNPAYFEQSSLFSFNTWKRNYWDNWEGMSIYRINGAIKGIITLESWLNFDLRPVKQPYEI